MHSSKERLLKKMLLLFHLERKKKKNLHQKKVKMHNIYSNYKKYTGGSTCVGIC